MNKELEEFIQTKRQKGISDSHISSTLIAAGWSKELIDAHLQPGSVEDPVPLPPVHASARHTSTSFKYGTYGVEYIVMLLSLWIAAVAFGASLFYLISPNSGMYGTGELFSAASTAALLVNLPIYTLLFFRLKRQEKKSPLLRQNILRYIGIYIALISTFLTAVGHIIWNLFILMGGDGYNEHKHSSVTEILHILIILAIAVPIWIYYSRELRMNNKKS